ncbi:MAG: DUF5655 domain-containing protein [Actinomyces sp.]|uniref:DUF5655 domain-containing protein n=1 Tax=Actinomyces sp. TaxID=29317 RepID=UPI0026DBE7C2|nr:DUF5655 domain-containing protein [Actinomyces sp.]MDO4243230.1 DUF5655 domain-containing protein [Actinomyces sp.]
MPMEPKDMVEAVTRTLAERTGRGLEEWVALVEAAAGEGALDPGDPKAVRAWLKSEHGLPQNSRWAVADATARRHGWEPPTVAGHTEAMYSGRKAPLRPLHDAVVEAGLALGGVEAQGRAGYIPLVRRTQFAAVGPGTYGRLRVGLRFRTEVPDDRRLEPAKGFAQATHVVHVAPHQEGTDPGALARSLEPLLRAAWEQN